MFDPRNGGFWLIGPNRETGDTFYLCRQCTAFMEETTTPTTAAPTAPPTAALPFLSQRIDEECGCGCGGGDCDCWDSDYEYDNYDEEPRQGDYDHSEECS